MRIPGRIPPHMILLLTGLSSEANPNCFCISTAICGINGKINNETAREALNLLGVDEYGLDGMDRQFLLALIEKFSGGPAGLNTLASSLSEEMDTIEDVIEPFLLQNGFINRTPRGRVATEKPTSILT